VTASPGTDPTYKPARSQLFIEVPPAVSPSTSTRAESPVSAVRPPSNFIDQAVEMARQHSNTRMSTNRQTVQRLVARFWPGYVETRVAFGIRYYGQFKPERDLRDWRNR
jgi:hypothetical protein